MNLPIMRHILSIFIFSLAIILGSCSNEAQDYESSIGADAIKTSGTLSNQRIQAITQDSLGYIWFGTYRGLNRFNGHEMQQYFCDDTPNGLPDNQVWDVFVDHHGRLWVATKSGVAYHTYEDDFKQIPVADATKLNKQFAENKKGDLFLLQTDKVLRYDSVAERFEAVVNDIGTASYINTNMYIDAEDKLWIVSEAGVKCFNSYTLDVIDQIESQQSILHSCIYRDELWLTGQDELRIYDVVHHQWKEVPEVLIRNTAFKGAYIECMQPMPQGKLLISTRNGFFDYDPDEQTLTHQSEAAFPFVAPDFVTTRIFCDDKPNLWLCSELQGYEVRSQSQRRFNADTYLRSAFRGIPVTAVHIEGNETLWIATQSHGLYTYDIQTHDITKYDFSGILSLMHDEEPRFYAMMIDRAGDIWVTTVSNGVLQLRRKGQKLEKVRSFKMNDMIISINQDKFGTIWAGAYSNSYYSLREGDASFTEHKILTNLPSYTSCLVNLEDGRMAALTKGQALRFIDPERMEMERQAIADSVLERCIARSTFLPTALLQDKQGDLWMGTVSNGLLHYDMESQELTTVPGAPCEDISSIELSPSGNYLWVSTQHGLGVLDMEKREFVNFYESDGIGGNEFYDRASCKLPDGTLIFGGAHGLTVFDPRFLQDNTEPRLYFENLKIDNRIVRPWMSKSIEQSLHTVKEIKLGYNQTNFSLTFAALDFSGMERYNYQYMLEGFNSQWVDASTTREAFYANLTPGRYYFHVRATSKDQHRVIAERSIPIYISPAPWATWWAWLIYLCIAVAVIYNTVRLILRNRAERRTRLISEREKEHERRINRMNMNFFANVSHEFRTPLTVISAPIAQMVNDQELTGETRHLLSIVQRSVNRMLRLVNQMMDFHKLEDDALRLEVRRQDIIQVLRSSAEVFKLQASEKKIELNTYGMEDNYLLWIDADKIEKIIYNLLGNAVKYTPSGGKIDLTFDATPQQIRFSVSDNGAGVPDDQKDKIFERYYQLRRQEQGQFNWGTGIGLYYAQKLAHLHHGKIEVSDRADGASGTVFTVTLPAEESAYTEVEKTTLQATQQSLYPLAEADYSIEEETSTTGSNYQASPNEGDQKVSVPTVLVIDDDVEIVHYVKTLLSSKYQVIGRFDADAGIEVVQQKAPDIILCDVMMPGRDGFDFCKQVKNDLQLCHIPVVLLTAKTATSDMVQGLGIGADAYVAKPFDPAYLLALIDSILKNREKTRSLLATNTQSEVLEETDNMLTAQDKAFLGELYKIMEQELANPDLDVSRLTEMLHVSRSKLYYKIKGLTGENPSVFFRQYKLNRAAELIKEGKYNISEISLLTGFSTLSHFSTSFKKQFGVTPSEY